MSEDVLSDDQLKLEFETPQFLHSLFANDPREVRYAAELDEFIDKCLADLAKAAGTPLPMPLRSFGRWILEFPTHYNDLHVDPRLRLGRPRVVVPVDKGIGSVVFLAKNLWVESLRSGPRFDALLKRVGHPSMWSPEATQLD